MFGCKKEAKAVRMAEKVVQYSKGTVDFADALGAARSFYAQKTWTMDLFTHVGDNYVAIELSRRLPRMRINANASDANVKESSLQLSGNP